MADTQTLTLADFLLARFAEDEEVALAASASNPERTWEVREVDYEGMWVMSTGYDWPRSSGETDQTEHIARHDPARVLAEREAKRRIVEFHLVKHRHEGAGGFNCFTLRSLALPYAGHPDYREEWKP